MMIPWSRFDLININIPGIYFSEPMMIPWSGTSRPGLCCLDKEDLTLFSELFNLGKGNLIGLRDDWIIFYY